MSPPRRLKVLVVDDEPCILHSTAMILREWGHEAVELHDWREVAEVARRTRPDLLLQDLRMPGLDVEALVGELRADPLLRALPVVLFSASVDLQEVAERAGIPHRLEKPFRPQELSAIVTAASDLVA